MNNGDSTRMQRHLTTILTEFATEGGTGTPASVLTAATRVALRRVGGVSYASITTSGATDRFETACRTDDIAQAADHAQYQAGHGPILEAIATGEPYCLTDTRHAGRWLGLGTTLAHLKVYGALSVPLGEAMPDGNPVAASLNLYANAAGAFSATSLLVATMLAAHAGPRWETACSAARVTNLERALANRTTIGAAVGILMAHHTLSHDEATERLREISHRSNRRVSDLAADIVNSGAILTSTKRAARIPASRTSKTDSPTTAE